MTYRKELSQVYTGNGEGMAMAAAGQALRAVGQGFKVRVIEFLHGNSESNALRTALVGQGGITINEFGQHTASITEAAELVDSGLAQQALDAAEAATASGEYDLVILGQVNLAPEWKLIELHDVLSILRHKHEKVELVLTGCCAHPEVIALADLVTELREVKHPYLSDASGQRGINCRCAIAGTEPPNRVRPRETQDQLDDTQRPSGHKPATA